MNKSKTLEAVEEAKRFIKKAEIVLESQKDNKWDGFYGSRETGDLRRASMDLTRSLVKLRCNKAYEN